MRRMSLIMRGIKEGVGFLCLMFGIIIFLACSSSSTDAARILTMPPAPAASPTSTASSSSFMQFATSPENHSEGRGAVTDHTSSTLDNKGTCTLCEQFVSQGIYYVTENKTQTAIIDSLNQACSLLHSPYIQQQCTTLVDQHISLFFQEVAAMKPTEFCRQLNFCDNYQLAVVIETNGSNIYHQIGSSK